MPRGGARKNAGRKSGEAWASPKPQPVRVAARAVVRRALAGSDNPLEILLSIAADEAVPVDTRIVAAVGAAPYMFPKLSAAVVQQHHTVTKIDGPELLARLSDRIAKLSVSAPPAAIEAEGVDAPDTEAAA
jgi:hypothetical protein